MTVFLLLQETNEINGTIVAGVYPSYALAHEARLTAEAEARANGYVVEGPDQRDDDRLLPWEVSFGIEAHEVHP